MADTNFYKPEEFLSTAENEYGLLPFRFSRYEEGRYFLSNEVGEHLHLPDDVFRAFVKHELEVDNPAYLKLKSKHFLTDKQSSAHFNVLASKYRTKKSFLEGFTKLHIFVTSLRCNQSCPYCQVSRQGKEADASVYDMTPEVLEKSVRMMIASPAPSVTMEFQGGEPLINFDLVKDAVRLAKNLNHEVGKNIDYVVCTNLSLLEDGHLDWCVENDIMISTSLDGPDFLHDKHRPMGKGKPSHATVTKNIRRCQEALGRQSVSALMTTTRNSLMYPKEIVDEYLRMDLGSIFVRELNPFGFAVKSASAIGYSTEEFLDFYKKVLLYIFEINREGRTFSESFAALVLTKMLTPWPIGFVDLQSPSGAGIGVCLYNYDGDVYASDESRMLAEVGDATFRLGNVLENSYDDIFFGETMQTIAAAFCNEALAGCSDCAYQVYCGADPVRHYRTQGDIFGNRASSSGFCQKNMSIISYLVNLLDTADDDLERIFWAWIMREDVNKLKLFDKNV